MNGSEQIAEKFNEEIELDREKVKEIVS